MAMVSPVPPLSAAAYLSAHLDQLVRVATMLIGSPTGAEDLVARRVRANLGQWQQISNDPHRALVLQMARRVYRLHRAKHPTPPGPLAGLPTSQRAALVVAFCLDDSPADWAKEFGRSVRAIDKLVTMASATLIDRLALTTAAHPEIALASWLQTAHETVKSSAKLRSDLIAAAVAIDPLSHRNEPQHTQPGHRFWSVPQRSTLTKVSLVLASTVLFASIPLTKSLFPTPPQAAPVTAPLATRTPTLTSVQPTVIRPPPRAVMDPATCQRQSDLDTATDSRGIRDAQLIGLCWSIETGNGTLWAAAKTDSDKAAEALSVMANLRYYTSKSCRTNIPIRPVLLRTTTALPEPVSVGCLTSGDNPVANAFSTVAVSLDWTINAPEARCDPRVSSGLAYQPYTLISGEVWDLGVLCVDSPADATPTSFAVVTGDRLVAARAVADRWVSTNGIAYCTSSISDRPRVALWLAKAADLGQIQGVFGPNACPVGPAVVTLFRMLTAAQNRFLATPDLSDLTLEQSIEVLRESGFEQL